MAERTSAQGDLPNQAGQEDPANQPGLITLDSIPTPARPQRVDPRAESEEEELVSRQQQIADEFRQAELEGIKQDIAERRRYARRIFTLVCFWLVALFALLFVAGWAPGGFKLADSALLALIGGTTANVLGIFVLVARYLFWRK